MIPRMRIGTGTATRGRPATALTILTLIFAVGALFAVLPQPKRASLASRDLPVPAEPALFAHVEMKAPTSRRESRRPQRSRDVVAPDRLAELVEVVPVTGAPPEAAPLQARVLAPMAAVAPAVRNDVALAASPGMAGFGQAGSAIRLAFRQTASGLRSAFAGQPR